MILSRRRIELAEPTTKAALRLKDYHGWKLPALWGRDVPLKCEQKTILILKQPGAAAPEPVFPTRDSKGHSTALTRTNDNATNGR